MTIGLRGRGRWRVLLVGTFAQIVGQIFDKNVYLLTSNGGDLLLLIAMTYSFNLIEEDLEQTGAFADYLHRSNMAFTHRQHISQVELMEIGDPMAGDMSNNHDHEHSHGGTDSSSVREGKGTSELNDLPPSPVPSSNGHQTNSSSNNNNVSINMNSNSAGKNNNSISSGSSIKYERVSEVAPTAEIGL